MLKDLFDKGKCLVGFHQGEWAFDAPSRCGQTRVCPVCAARESRIEHGWSDWTHRSPKRCDLVRQCGRCRERETRTEHAWGDWAYAADGECVQARTCSRCRSVAEDTRTVHQWGAWAYDEAHRAPLRRCERCSMRMSRFARQPVAQAAHDPATATAHTNQSAAETPASRRMAIAQLFASGDGATMAAVAEPWLDNLPASMKDLVRQAVISDALESRLSAACMCAEPYARGVDAALGVDIGLAVCLVSEAQFSETSSRDYLFTFATGARVCLLGFAAQGEHEASIGAAEQALAWLGERGYTDSHATLLMDAIEAHLQLQHLEQARTLLGAVEDITIPDAQPADQRRRQDLRRRFDAVAGRSATELAPEHPDPDGAFRTNYADLQTMVAGLRDMDQQMFGGEASPFRNIIDTLTAEVTGEAPSQADWVATSQSTSDTLTEILSGGAGGMTALRNRNRAIKAANIFADPVKGRAHAAIDASLTTLLEAREWARTHDCPDDESFALWGMYLCYSRSGREPDAIDALQALRTNLETRRSQIADPMKRAGVFLEYPYLFESLCRLLCRAGRATELLDAMEGAKGRALADALTSQRGEPVPDTAFRQPIETLVSLLRTASAHYLSFFVDDEETYAVLMTKDGSAHCHAIALGKAALGVLVKSVDPTRWTRPRAGYFGKATTVPERLAPLVAWLEPLVDGGVLSADDHLCYCPDEYLHLVPLHYLPLHGAPLVRHLSVSRIHSAAALTSLLGAATQAPSEFVAVQVPAQQDAGNAEKLTALGRVAGWLAQHSSGTTLARERATIDALARLDLTDRIVHFATHGVFPKDDIEGRNPNPFTSSGLALASGGALPSLQSFTAGASDEGLLNPERVLRLNVRGSHVTLQACVTGLAKEGIGGDALGLDLAFLIAGAQSLLTTHWDVSAGASAHFAVRFYQQWLVEGSTRAAAWRGALLEALEEARPEDGPAEYYWAAFSLSGDWR